MRSGLAPGQPRRGPRRCRHARADLADRQVLAPADGRSSSVYSLGEIAPAGGPVLSLLPGGAEGKFYVGETNARRWR